MADRDSREAQKHRVRQRIQGRVLDGNYEYIPEKRTADYFNGEASLRVAVYARVSTDRVQQTSSYELQKKYYEEFVRKHPNWDFVALYADEGASGTTDRHRDGFKQMLADCRAGKIDLIITKSVSRFARNVVLCIGIVRDLKRLNPPVGVFFESEHIFSLNEEKSITLTFLATMAEEESHIRSRSMESSLRMRLDHGLPLTPELLGYRHDDDGNLAVNPEEAPTVKLAFFLYLYGYSTRQIAEIFNALGRKSYLGNSQWTGSGIIGILRNERHCGEVYTRKTFTPDFRDHRSIKNRGERPRSKYRQHHDPIVSPADFTAVQRLLDNAKYHGHRFLPRLQVVDAGLLRGFVVIHPRWAGFGEREYTKAAQSVGGLGPAGPLKVELHPGGLDLRGFQAVRPELCDTPPQGFLSLREKSLSLSARLLQHLGGRGWVELLLDPLGKRLAIRPTGQENRCGVACARRSGGVLRPRPISAAAFGGMLFQVFGWDVGNYYRIIPQVYREEEELVLLCEAANAQAFLPKSLYPGAQPLTPYRGRVRAVPSSWAESFGEEYYWEQAMKEDPLPLAGGVRTIEDGNSLQHTTREELEEYIRQELAGIDWEEPHGHGTQF